MCTPGQCQNSFAKGTHKHFTTLINLPRLPLHDYIMLGFFVEMPENRPPISGDRLQNGACGAHFWLFPKKRKHNGKVETVLPRTMFCNPGLKQSKPVILDRCYEYTGDLLLFPVNGCRYWKYLQAYRAPPSSHNERCYQAFLQECASRQWCQIGCNFIFHAQML